jgi:signal transduction histidine kinase
MDYTIRSLRDFITSDIRQVEKRQRLKLAAIVDAAIRQLADFAQNSRVRVVPKNEIGDAAVLGSERDLVRAFTNLLHNSIKYSWHRNRIQSPWVTVRMWKKNDKLCTTFENWGVPIGKDELESNLIFQLGYRGKWSKDRGRLGTGIGLTDAREVALNHRGHVAVESRPARSHTSASPDTDDYMKQPFITTVTISLPETENDE